MKRICIRFYVTEFQKHGGKLVYEWLLERAHRLGVPGGTALRAMAGYGRHGVLHEESFFELAGDVPIEIEFVTDEQQAQQLVDLLQQEGLRLFYLKMPVETGIKGNGG